MNDMIRMVTLFNKRYNAGNLMSRFRPDRYSIEKMQVSHYSESILTIIISIGLLRDRLYLLFVLICDASARSNNKENKILSNKKGRLCRG